VNNGTRPPPGGKKVYNISKLDTCYVSHISDDDENLNYTGYSELFNITAWIKLEEKKKPNKLIPKLNFICKNLVRGPKCPD